jgi:threonine aldolase
MIKRSFASDNNAGVHPEVIEAIRAANEGHVIAYGDDPFTARAVKLFQKHFGRHVAVYFVFGGTGANVLGLKAITRSHQAIICAETAHVNVDECGAPENFSGCKLLTVSTPDGKLRVDQIKPLLHGIGVEHHVQPSVITISQATEMGTVYTEKELKTLAGFAHDHGMLLHVDGARLSNAAVSLDASLKEITADVGVDVLSFGGTKNGMIYGEAVVFFDSKRRLSSNTFASRACNCRRRCASSRLSLRRCCPEICGAAGRSMQTGWRSCSRTSSGSCRRSRSRNRWNQTASSR